MFSSVLYGDRHLICWFHAMRSNLEFRIVDPRPSNFGYAAINSLENSVFVVWLLVGLLIGLYSQKSDHVKEEDSHKELLMRTPIGCMWLGCWPSSSLRTSCLLVMIMSEALWRMNATQRLWFQNSFLDTNKHTCLFFDYFLCLSFDFRIVVPVAKTS